MKTVVPSEIIEKKIFLLRGQKVMLDFHLALLCLCQVVRPDTTLKKTRDESEGLQGGILRFQIETSKTKRGGRRYLPFAFTEQGRKFALREKFSNILSVPLNGLLSL